MNEGPKVNWEYRQTLPIHDRMKDVVTATIKASEKQLDVYRRKLRKMQLGS